MDTSTLWTVEPSRIMPNIYYLGFKAGQALHYLSSEGGNDDSANDNAVTALWHKIVSLWTSLDVPALMQWLVFEFPAQYRTWWWDLVRNDPIHVLVETTLILSILYILMARTGKDWKETEEFLSPKEEEELLREWKLHGRAPLAPPLSPASSDGASTTTGTTAVSFRATTASPHEIVVHKVHGPYIDVSIENAPPQSESGSNLTPKSHNKKAGYHQQQNQKQQQQQSPVMTVLNFATFDTLGMASAPSVRQAADAALTKYGCGSCGPRGFYGTIDTHLELEAEYAQFLKTDGAILYSDGASTCASTLAAFAKRGDLLVCDEGIYEPLRTGVTLSRAHVKWFKHNDMADLRRVLTSIQKHDAKVKRPLNAQRRFLVVEGLYKTTGTLCPLNELVKLKHEFCYRLILDESHSFGTLGATGRGVHELYGCKLMHDVEITTIALENAMGGIGGITVGTEEVVEHQRLSGSGYCFSASSPPFTAAAAIQSLHLLRDKPETTLQPLQDNVAYLHFKLTQLCHEVLDDVLLVTSSPESPIVILQVADIPETRDLEEWLFLNEVVQECLQPHPAAHQSKSRVAAAAANNKNQGMALVVVQSPPAIRITVSASHTHEHLDTCLRILTEAVMRATSSK